MTRLGIEGKLKLTLESTSPCESMISTVRVIVGVHMPYATVAEKTRWLAKLDRALKLVSPDAHVRQAEFEAADTVIAETDVASMFPPPKQDPVKNPPPNTDSYGIFND